MTSLLRTFVLLNTIAGLAVNATGQQQLLEQLHRDISKSEERLLNLRVDGKCRNELWDSATASWRDAGEMDVTAWYIDAPGGKVRIDCHKEVAVWTGGAAPFFQDAFLITYNGRSSQKLYKEEGPLDKQHQDLRGKVEFKRSAEVQIANWASGWAYSLYGFFDQEGKRLSSIFDSKDLVVTVGIWIRLAATPFSHT
jgi:hypothetical protein